MSIVERSAMKATVFGVASPVPVAQSPYFFFSHQFRMSMAGLLFFVIAGGGGVSAAAQGALPGDVLYPVKISINEKVEVALAPDAAAKSVVEVKLAERRVAEAKTLSAQGKFDAKTADTLSADFDAHAAQAIALAEPEEEDQTVADVAVEATMMAPAPERAAKNAPTARTMMVTTFAAPEVATSSEKEKVESENKFEKRKSLRESLREKRELIEELKERGLNAGLIKDGTNKDDEVAH